MGAACAGAAGALVCARLHDVAGNLLEVVDVELLAVEADVAGHLGTRARRRCSGTVSTEREASRGGAIGPRAARRGAIRCGEGRLRLLWRRAGGHARCGTGSHPRAFVFLSRRQARVLSSVVLPEPDGPCTDGDRGVQGGAQIAPARREVSQRVRLKTRLGRQSGIASVSAP